MWDLFPTFLQLARVRQIENIDGISILPAIKGESQRQHEYFYWEFHEGGGKPGSEIESMERIKLKVSNADEPIELYDLKN
jgi:arylsulfatase A-like enzyme